MNKITVIELLNKIANGEEIPEKIKHREEIYELKGNLFIIYENKYGDSLDLVQYLNDTVEIIEEDNKIEKPYIEITNAFWTDEQANELIDNFERYDIAIRKLIDEINKLKEK